MRLSDFSLSFDVGRSAEWLRTPAMAGGVYCTLSLLVLSFQTASSRAADDAIGSTGNGELAANVELIGDGDSAVKGYSAKPNTPLGHWQRGEINIDDTWIRVEESQKRAAAEPRQAEYSKRRAAAAKELPSQLDLARWCSKNKLDDEAKYHYSLALSLDPNNEESLRALDVRWIGGQLVTAEDVKDYKERLQWTKSAAKRWQPIIAKWRRALSDNSPQVRDAAINEIRATTDLSVIPSIETVTIASNAKDKDAAPRQRLALAFLEAIGKRIEQPATESLLRHAVCSPDNQVRLIATQQLKQRDPDNYVPLLLDSLEMPIEFSYELTTSPDGNVRYTQSLYRAGAFRDTALDANFSTTQHILPGRRFRQGPDGQPAFDKGESDIEIEQRVARTARNRQSQYLRTAAATESLVQRSNAETAQRFSQIAPVLAMTTGKEFATQNQWWDWWREKNEYYTAERPVDYGMYTNTDHRYYGLPEDEIVRHSCFAKGTPVWTKLGLRPIETIEQGDFVLAQDIDSGELTFKPVATRTTRPTGKLVKMRLDGEDIYTTTGHPFWVEGVGWRMVKDLKDGAELHGLRTATRVQAVEDAVDGEAYNLVVPDFATYFVGEQGLLVHDITPRAPTISAVPGISKAATSAYEAELTSTNSVK